MKKNYMFTIILAFVFMLFIQNSFAIMTYVGVEIQELKDDPAHSCVGQSGYGDQGRIRGFVSNPTAGYPIYYKLYKVSDSSVLKEGNLTANTDFEKGDVMMLPEQADLTPGEEYGIFFDIDAIKIYLQLPNLGDFNATINDTYWTAGMYRAANYQDTFVHSHSNCQYKSTMFSWNNGAYFLGIANNRDVIKHSCITDGVANNCDEENIVNLLVGTFWAEDFNIDNSYLNLHTPTVGNLEFTFVFN